MEGLHTVFRRYLSLNAQNESFLYLFISKRLIHGSATALLGVFVPIFLYEVSGNNFYLVGSFFAVSTALYLLFIVPGTMFMDQFGTKVALAISAVCSIGYYGILYLMTPSNIWLLAVPLLLVFTAFRILHWVPYFIDFTTFTKDGERGRNVGLTYATIAFLGIVGPILAGYIISNSGYDTLFVISMVLLFFAAISYLFVPTVNETFKWGYMETFKNLFAKKYRNISVASFANGLEGPVATIAWPIFLYELLDGNILEIGALATIITGVTIAVQLTVGNKLDTNASNQKKYLRTGSILYAIGWIIKMFVLSAFQVFFVGLYHNVTKIFSRTSYDTILWDMSADQGHYVDEFSVLREIANQFGKLLSLCMIVGLTLFISIQWTFIIGATAALLFNFLYRTIHD